MKEYGFEMQLDPHIQANPAWQPGGDFEYWNLRSGQTHDFDHMLAYASGQASDPIYTVRYEDMLLLTPTEVRGKLGMRIREIGGKATQVAQHIHQ